MSVSELVKQIVNLAEKQIGTPYVWGWKDSNGFDCSGFILWLFSQLGIVFQVRFRTVEFLADSQLISRDQVQAGDLMYWHEEPGKSEHNFVYHIELVVQKPIFQEGRWVIKTIGSSKNKEGFSLSGGAIESEGVDYRIRIIDDRKSFGRISYFDKILQYKNTWDAQYLLVQKPQDVKTRWEL